MKVSLPHLLVPSFLLGLIVENLASKVVFVLEDQRDAVAVGLEQAGGVVALATRLVDRFGAAGAAGTQLASCRSTKSGSCMALKASFRPTLVRFTESRLKARLPDRIAEVSIERSSETPRPASSRRGRRAPRPARSPATGSGGVTKSGGEHWKR